MTWVNEVVSIMSLSSWKAKKQPSRGVLKKRCSENMQHIYKRTPMPKCDFNKAALQLYWNRDSTWVFSCKFAAYFHMLHLFLKIPLEGYFWKQGFYFLSWVTLWWVDRRYLLKTLTIKTFLIWVCLVKKPCNKAKTQN